MIIPRITKPYEPGLPALGDDLENYLVVAGGSVTLKLEPGDKFKIINLEGLQQAELVAFNSKGECSLSSLSLKSEHKGELTKKILTSNEESAQIAYSKLKRLGHEVNSINQSILVFSKDAQANSIEEFESNDSSICIISAPGETEITHENIPASELRVIVQRSRKREEGEFLLPDPLMDPVEEIFVNRYTAMSYEVKEGDFIQIIDIYGRQCSDFMAFDADKLHKGQELAIDTTNSRYLMGSAFPMPGLHSKYYDENQFPMVEVYRDTVGRHDTFGTACTSKFYDDLGYFGHPNCSDNFNRVLDKFTLRKRLGWNAINLFYNTAIDANNSLIFDEPWSRPGDYVMFKALKNLSLCIFSMSR